MGRFLISVVSPGEINIIQSTCKGGQPVILAGILAGAFPFPDNVSGKVFQENIAEAAVDKTVKKVPVLVPIFEAVDHVGAVIVDSLQILLAVLFLIFLQNVFQMGRKHFLFGGEIPVKRHSGNACQLGKLRYGNVMVDSGFSLIRVRRAFTIFSRVCWLGVFFEDFCFSMVKLLLKITL